MYINRKQRTKLGKKTTKEEMRQTSGRPGVYVKGLKRRPRAGQIGCWAKRVEGGVSIRSEKAVIPGSWEKKTKYTLPSRI